MKKYLKAGFLFILAAAVMLAVGCNPENGADEPEPQPEPQPAAVYYTVSFDSVGGSEVASQSIEEGKTAESPADPAKDGFVFSGWYTSAAYEVQYDFESAVTADIKLYASWTDAASGVSAVFYSDESTVYKTVQFTDGGRISKPDNPKKDGYYFAGWFTAEGAAYKAATKYTGSQNFYAKWLKIYTFEAEKTQLTGLDPDEDDTCSDTGKKLGQSYSGNVAGANLIGGCDCGASGGLYITSLYYNGAFLEFEINSDEACTDAILMLRLSAEYKTMTYTKDNFTVTVNGAKIAYESFTITASEADLTSTQRTQMQDFSMGVISLNAGENVVRLEVTNNDKQFPTGTVDAAAPIIDCIKIYSATTLTMTEYENK